jgi:hypothetical protein
MNDTKAPETSEKCFVKVFLIDQTSQIINTLSSQAIIAPFFATTAILHLK